MLSINIKLDNDVKFKSYNDEELSQFKEIVDENIEYITKKDYDGLSQDFLITRKQEILEPLFGIRKKIKNLLNYG